VARRPRNSGMIFPMRSACGSAVREIIDRHGPDSVAFLRPKKRPTRQRGGLSGVKLFRGICTITPTPTELLHARRGRLSHELWGADGRLLLRRPNRPERLPGSSGAATWLKPAIDLRQGQGPHVKANPPPGSRTERGGSRSPADEHRHQATLQSQSPRRRILAS